MQSSHPAVARAEQLEVSKRLDVKRNFFQDAIVNICEIIDCKQFAICQLYEPVVIGDQTTHASLLHLRIGSELRYHSLIFIISGIIKEALLWTYLLLNIC